MATLHNTATKGDFAKTVLMPGDPLRAQEIAGIRKKLIRAAKKCVNPLAIGMEMCYNIYCMPLKRKDVKEHQIKRKR